MPNKYIQSVGSTTERDTQSPNLSIDFAGLIQRRDTLQIEFRDPVTGLWLAVPSVTSGVQTLRARTSTANVIAGVTLLAAIPLFKYRVVDITMISIGGAAATATSVNVRGTQATATVQLLAVAVAALTQSAVVRAGAANAVVLADGASFVENDVNTPITLIGVGAGLTGSTFIDVILDYVLTAG